MTTANKKVIATFFTLSYLFFAPSVSAQTLIGKIDAPLSRTVSGNYTLGLTVSGESMNLVLSRGSVIDANTRLVNLNGYPSQSSFQAFQGVIQDEDNSWVRLGVHDDSLSGVISRQGIRYQLTGLDRSVVTLKRLSEKSSHRLNSHAAQLRQTQSLPDAAAATTEISHVVDVAIAVDSQYNSVHNGNGLEKALSIINSVDGIYREEFGIALRVVSALNVTERSNDPFYFGNVQIETMLRGLREYRMQTTHFNDASLVHLFTGNQNSDAPVGLAWIDTACRTDGYDVGLSTPYRHEILLAAHEIAHNLGAMHDTDTACNIETDKVMWPYISDHTSQNFSNCTRSSVRQSLQNSCHIETVDLQVSLFENDENTYTATVRNNDATQSSTSSTLTIELPDNSIATALDGDCVAPTNRVECAIGTLLPGAEDRVRVSIENFPGITALEFTASIASNDLPDLAPGNNSASIFKGGDSFNDGPGSEEIAQTSSGGGANSGVVNLDGGGSAQILTALVFMPLALRRRDTQLINQRC